jgi:hypothetical protein
MDIDLVCSSCSTSNNVAMCVDCLKRQKKNTKRRQQYERRKEEISSCKKNAEKGI